MELIHVEQPSILLLVNEALDLVQVWRVRRHQRLAPCIIRVKGLRSSAHGQPAVCDGYFETDGLGCIRLLLWITVERPENSISANFNRFQKLFDDNPVDATMATLRILTGQESQAAGETKFFIAQQWAYHPIEMAQIALAGEILRAS